MARVVLVSHGGEIEGELHSMPYIEARVSVELMDWIEETFILANIW